MSNLFDGAGKSEEQITISNIIKRLEKLEQFKVDTIEDINEITDLVEVELLKDRNKENISVDLFEGNVKDKIVRNFLELNMDIANEDVQKLMTIPVNKRQDFQNEDLDNSEQVYWACKILLEYIGEYDD